MYSKKEGSKFKGPNSRPFIKGTLDCSARPSISVSLKLIPVKDIVGYSDLNLFRFLNPAESYNYYGIISIGGKWEVTEG